MNKPVIADWLSQTFSQATDVRRASTDVEATLVFQNHHADVVVQTWMGARIYIYVVDEEPRLRDLKTILKDNTRDSIGTLFVVATNLLPADGTTTRTPDWLQSLQSLNEGGVYGYRFDTATPTLIRANFSAGANVDEFYCWYTADFQIESVTSRRREVHKGIKGTWQLADIASPNFKRRINYERINQRFHYRTRETHQPASGKTTTDKFRACCRMLNVSDKADHSQVKQAYRQMALRVHPDVSALPHFEAERRFKELQEAYDYIKRHHGWD